MRYLPLGSSDIRVSEIGLGTMTFGQQNTPSEAFQQLDFALEQGMNLIDTAEMYPVPARAETQGATERIIGDWLRHQDRSRIILATKITGPGRPWHWIRGGNLQITPEAIRLALTMSLERLQTDYIDLYQIHWPDRYVPLFGESYYDPTHERPTVPILEQLSALHDWVKAGVIRAIGLSNETPWGVCQFCTLAKQHNLTNIVSIQNAYHLLNRSFEQGLAEVCRQEQVSLIAYSPLAFGILTGKYQQGARPPGSRLALFEGFGRRYLKLNVEEAVQGYSQVAAQAGLTLSELALAFARSRWFMTSILLGATSLEQLRANLRCLQITLSPETLAAIEAVHQRYPNPTP
ncbi:MAG: aldo/keto reductase [Thermostichales cyanobacterium DRC_bins_46]